MPLKPWDVPGGLSKAQHLKQLAQKKIHGCSEVVHLASEQVPSKGPIKLRTDCVQLGAAVRNQQCPTCSGTVKIKVFACQLHGECSISKNIPGICCCQNCTDYQSAQTLSYYENPPH